MFDNFIIGQLIARRFSLGPNTTFLRTDASSFLLWRRGLRQRCWQSLADRIREDASNQDPVSTEWSCHRATQEVLPSSLTATWSQRTSGSGVTSLKSVGAWPEAGLMAPGHHGRASGQGSVLPHWAVTWKLESVNRKSRGNLECSRHCLGRPEYKGVLI